MKYKMIMVLCLGSFFNAHSMGLLNERLQSFKGQFYENTFSSVALVGAYNACHNQHNLLSLNKDIGVMLLGGWGLSMLNQSKELACPHKKESCLINAENRFIKFMHVLRRSIGQTTFASSYLAYNTYMDRTLSWDKIVVGSYIALNLANNLYKIL